MEQLKPASRPGGRLAVCAQLPLYLVRSDHLTKTRSVPVIDLRPSIDLGHADGIGLDEKRFPAIGRFVLPRSKLPYHSDDLDCGVGKNHHRTEAAFVWLEI